MTVADGNALLALVMYALGAALIWLVVFEQQRRSNLTSWGWWLMAIGLTALWPVAVPLTLLFIVITGARGDNG